MRELDKLLAWMQANGYTTETIAHAVGMSKAGVYQILYVRKRISPGFKVRFIQRFGLQAANRIFESGEIVA